MVMENRLRGWKIILTPSHQWPRLIGFGAVGKRLQTVADRLPISAKYAKKQPISA
jgi:hypothetical protein